MANRKIGLILKIFFVIVFMFGLKLSVSAYDTISSGGKVGYKLYNGETFATSSFSIVNNSGKDVYLGGSVEEFDSFMTKPPVGVAVTTATPTVASILSVSSSTINIGSSTTWSWTLVLFAKKYEATCLDPAIGNWSAWNSLNNGANLLSISGEPATTGTWQCKVRGCNDKGCGPESNAMSVIVNPIPPVAPTNFAISPSVTATTPNSIQSITFNWSAVTGATKYRYSCDDFLTSAETTGTSWPVGVAPAANYTCSVKACNGNICGTAATMSNITVKSSAPSGLSKSPSSPNSSNAITYSWSVVSGASSYQANVNGGGYVALSPTCNTTACSLNGGSAIAGNYTINLKACNSGGTCGEISSISFNVTQFTPAAPTGLAYDPSAPNSNQSVTLSWGSVTGASSYKYSCDNFSTSAETTGTSWYIGTAPAGNYSCGVKACSGISCSAATSKAITVTAACVPSCTGKTCGGDDGCGGVCQTGSCSSGTYCVSGQCCYTSNSCNDYGLTCGTYTNICSTAGSISCGTCSSPYTCSSGSCVCTPNCSGKACGANDGCGGTCQTGSCSSGTYCVSGQCCYTSNSCNDYGLTCGTYSNICSTAGSVKCGPTCCTPSSACAANTCTGSTCSDGCGGTVAGTKYCCTPSSACAANTCTGSTCSDGCGGTVAGTKNCCVPNLTSANCSSYPTYHGCSYINNCGSAVCCP